MINETQRAKRRDLEDAWHEGATVAEIAAVLGISENNARYRLSRAGLPVVSGRNYTSLRAQVQEMRPIEAVEFLLTVLERLEIVRAGALDPIEEGLPGQHARRLWRVLSARPGRVIRTEALYEALYFDSPPGDEPRHRQMVAVMIWHLRRALPEGVGRIENVFGAGYKFVPAAEEGAG